ncbi:mercury resistance system periplasmic binding protein MerP [Psychrobacter sp. S1-30-MNA-CIBAN-0213]|uniref:mercury resistance system periplasmic binding protein MerP n=1 Tax=unclassified Psychrobacter TaxID=196806 RepID=UPI00331A85F2
MEQKQSNLLMTVKLDVPTTNCVTCPITVTHSLKKVDGVKKAEVTYRTKSAVIIYDDTKTNAETLMKATTNAGYPSTLRR